jgi:steroid 5-alpha reductase family enzyme
MNKGEDYSMEVYIETEYSECVQLGCNAWFKGEKVELRSQVMNCLASVWCQRMNSLMDALRWKKVPTDY